ncbi:MAG: AAA family ATPase [Muribaculaceae bacterium]|nr:AAA family ATPase [Muribaculaceae bacterium]
MISNNTIDYSILAESVLGKINEKETIKNKDDWKTNVEWIYDTKGNIKNHITNYELFINNHPKYAGKLKYNAFLQQNELDDKLFDDAYWNQLYRDCEVEIGLSTSSTMDKVVKMLPITNCYNPAIDYLVECGKKWDREKRVEDLFIRLLEADDTELNRKLTFKWFLAAVKRILQPGCKFDNMLILQGSQGIGKSTICEKIANGFYNSMTLEEINTKDLVDKMNKSWFMIIDEMDSFNKKEMSAIKSFLSQTKNSARLAYGKTTNEYLRHCVFIGSTNEPSFLRDTSSPVERRFWIIKCNKTKMDSGISDYLTQEIVDQIWGEVYTKFKEDENVYLDLEKELQEEFANTMNEFKTSNDDDGVIIARDILSRTYKLNEKGEFENMNDFFRQVTGENVYEAKSYINKLPTTWLSLIISNHYKVNRTGRYIAQGLLSEWDYKNARYNKDNQKCIVRKNELENEGNNEETYGLPF